MSAGLGFWLAVALVTAVTLFMLVRPLVRPRAKAPAARAAYDLAVYRDQLAEIERDQARGVITDEAAAAARLEIERRILASAERPPARAAGAGPAPRWLALGLAVALPAAALAVYAELGAPGLPGLPAAERQAATGDMAALVEQLARRMAERPDDVRGWLLLARSYASLGRYRDSADAFAAAIAHGAAEGPDGAQVQADYGEALTAAAGGEITVAAKAAFEAALADDPAHPQARFYLALAKAQAGEVEAALADWLKLEAEVPADAPWRPVLAAQIERAAAALGRDPETLPGRAAPPVQGVQPSPDEADMAAAAEMTPEDRESFIRGMVDRLAARLESQPDDLEGWQRLARSYGVLGETAKARDAWGRAAALAPDRADILLAYAQAIREAHIEESPLPPEFAATVARARELAPDDPLGLYLGGLAENASGNTAAARALWERLRERLPEGSPERAEIDARLQALPRS